MNFFNALGIATKRDEIDEEDFWVTEDKKEVSIFEVKGLDKNLKRLHINQLDEHRGAREQLDDFPALLIVNSFNKAKSLAEKEEAISSNVIKKAVQTHILILRTLDLCNVYRLIDEEKLSQKTFFDIVVKIG